MYDYIKMSEVISCIGREYRRSKTAKFGEVRGNRIDACKNILRDVNALPAADVVEVVRCKDCKHKPYSVDGQETGFSVRHPDDDERCPCLCMDGWYSWLPDDDFYCGYGDRRTDNG